MGFIDTTVINAKTVKKGSMSVATSQGSVPTILASPSSGVTNSVFATVNNSLSNVNRTVAGAVSTVNNTVNTVVGTVRAVDNAINYVGSAIRSVEGLFGSSKTGLATGISAKLSNIFKNTNVATAASVTSKISDPVYTNLMATKKPNSGPFKVDSLESGSQSISMTGSNSKLGSLATSMIGTSQATLINRFQLDSPSNLYGSATSSLASSKLSGLFSTVSKITNTVRGVAADVTAVTSQVQRVAYGIKREYDAVSGVITAAKGTFQSLTSISSLNDLQRFTGSVAGLSQSLGNFDLSTYYLENSVSSLIDETGAIVDTYRSGVDSGVANGVVDIMKKAGCYSGDTYYDSANVQASLYNMGLDLAARYGMTSEVNTLLGCSYASSDLAQKSITSAFASTVNYNLTLADIIVDKVKSPASLNTDFISRSILTNPNLKSSDTKAVDDLFIKLGTTTSKAMSVPAASTSAYPVLDYTLLSQMNPGFLNSVLGDGSVVNLFNGSGMAIQSNGKFALA